MNRLKTPTLIILVLLIATACNQWDDGWQKPPKDVKGYKPVYITKQDAFNVYAGDPEQLVKPGKIYIYGGYLFIVEKLKGIHVINNLDPSNPVPVAFLHIPGCNDVAVSAGILYADNVTDLVAFDINDLNNINLVKRLPGRFPHGVILYPDEADGHYFECVDTTKGFVINWEYTTLNDPKCYR